jgi:hypothetical protein
LLGRINSRHRKQQGVGILTFQEIDVEALKKGTKQPTMRRLKRQIIKEGFIYQLTLYGALFDKKNDKTTPIRTDIYVNKPCTLQILDFTVRLFMQFPPRWKYSIWAYNADTEDMKFRGKYD